MEKHRVGIYCGSFNPVHNGHITIAKEVVNQGLVDKVLMVATEGYWDKQGLMPLQERILMLKFFESENLIIEEELNSIKTTYELFVALQSKHPDWQLYLILGADNLINFGQWFNYKELLVHPFIIVKRNDVNENRIKEIMDFFNKINYSILNYKNIDISSTFIRENINNPEVLKDKVDPKVLEYLQSNLWIINEASNYQE